MFVALVPEKLRHRSKLGGFGIKGTVYDIFSFHLTLNLLSQSLMRTYFSLILKRLVP